MIFFSEFIYGKWLVCFCVVFGMISVKFLVLNIFFIKKVIDFC